MDKNKKAWAQNDISSIDLVMDAMIQFDHGDPMRIHHFIKVHEFARQIAIGEGMELDAQELLEVVAILHDIGIHPSEEKYGDSIGPHQEELGPEYARKLLEDVGGFSEEFTERVCYLIGHHHTYDQVDGLDYQILIEADFLVNGYEDGLSSENIQAMKERIFKTKTGIRLLETIYC